MAPGTAEVHLCGELAGALGFGSDALHCAWQLVLADARAWRVERGCAQVGSGLRQQQCASSCCRGDAACLNSLLCTEVADAAAAAAAVQGRTHVSSPQLAEDGACLTGVVWETPLALSLSTSSTRRWPALLLKVFRRTWFGRCGAPVLPQHSRIHTQRADTRAAVIHLPCHRQ